jgi:5'-deoxynucleotidase YfbR-like HD superfamily hydrolase
VAQHSIVVEDACAHLQPGLEPRWRLVALLHDAPEYVIGDMISPFKAALGVDYKAFEARLERAIHLRFGLPAVTPPEVKALIKAADHVSAWFEAVQLPGSARRSDQFFGPPPADYPVHLEPMAPAAAQARYLARFHTLAAALGLRTRARRVSHRVNREQGAGSRREGRRSIPCTPMLSLLPAPCSLRPHEDHRLPAQPGPGAGGGAPALAPDHAARS